jgi:hypothetical protein
LSIEGSLYTAELAPRVGYDAGFLEPYVSGLIGIGATEKLWWGEGTRFQFSVGGSLGLSVKLFKYFRGHIAYRFFHISNGSAIFGTKKPNKGYNTDMVVVGLEASW